MIADLLRRLTASEPAPLPDTDARLAMTALLVRIAKADGKYLALEIQQIDRIIQSRYGLNAVEAAKLRATAEKMERDAPDTVRFTRAIKDAVGYDHRLAVIESFWEVVLADGHRAEDENALLRTVAPLLGVTDQESALVRQRVEARRG